jgi:queuine tRNA-ribosyltransferase
VERGIDQFDCVAPTRLARHGVVYTPSGKLSVVNAALREDPAPIQDGCGCYTCSTGFSRAYLRHLFAARELLAYTLASLHNLFFILTLLANIRAAIAAEALNDFRGDFLARYQPSSGTSS